MQVQFPTNISKDLLYKRNSQLKKQSINNSLNNFSFSSNASNAIRSKALSSINFTQNFDKTKENGIAQKEKQRLVNKYYDFIHSTITKTARAYSYTKEDLSDCLNFLSEDNQFLIEKAMLMLEETSNKKPKLRFSPEELGKLAELTNSQNKSFAQYLVEETRIAKDDEIKPRFLSSEIIDILKNTNDGNMDVLEELLREKTGKDSNFRFFASGIIQIAQVATKGNADFIRLLAKETLDISGTKAPKFIAPEIAKILSSVSSNKAEYVMELVSITEIRKNGNEKTRYNVDEIIELTDVIDEDNFSLAKDLLYSYEDEKNSFKPRYNLTQIKNILSSVNKENVDVIRKIVKQANDNTKDENIRTFSPAEIHMMAQIATKNNIDFIIELAKLKYKTLDGTEKPRFSMLNISKLIDEVSIENIDFIKELANETLLSRGTIVPKLKVSEILQLVKIFNEQNKNFIFEFVGKVKLTELGNELLEYPIKDIAKLASFVSKENVQYISELASLEDTTKLKEGEKRFSLDEIAQFAELVNEDSIEFIKELSMYKYEKFGRVLYRFSSEDIRKIIGITTSDNISFIRELISKLVITRDGAEKPRFSSDDIYMIERSTYPKNRDFVRALVDEKILNLKRLMPKFDAFDISNMASKIRVENFEIAKKLAKMTEERSGVVRPRFTSTEIISMAEVLNEDNLSLVEKMLEEKILVSGTMKYKYGAQDIIKFVQK